MTSLLLLGFLVLLAFAAGTLVFMIARVVVRLAVIAALAAFLYYFVWPRVGHLF